MGTQGFLKVLIVIAMGPLAGWAINRAVRYQLKLWRSRSWPTLPGTVQKGEILHSGRTNFLRVPFRSLLGYAYTVNGHSYWGLFALIAEGLDTAEKLQKQADGKPVSVRHKPNHPEVSLLEEREFLGRRVIQDPFHLDNS